MAAKKKILFIHDAYPNQLSPVHEYLCKTGEVESFFLTQEVSRGSHQFEKDFPPNVFSYTPDGQISQNSYYYTGELEQMARGAVNTLRAVKQLVEHRGVDLIMAHDRSGHPHLLFDALNVPVVGYSEFPDFKSYGSDPSYPPTDEQLHVTLLSQAFTYQSVVKSAVTIVPSEYARMMYPEPIRQKVVAQMDAFDAESRRVYIPEKAAFKKEEGLTYVGFCANVLSSEKGLEHFIQITRQLCVQAPNMRFVLIGSEMGGASYGYERQFLEQKFGKDQKSFLQYLFEKYEIDQSKYILTGSLSGDVFSSTLYHVDFFLYPLQFGSANWGFFELLIRGKIVIASNRCFIPEMMQDGVNGFLLSIDDHAAWCRLAVEIAAQPEKYKSIGAQAEKLSRVYHVDHVAKAYLDIFDRWVWSKR